MSGLLNSLTSRPFFAEEETSLSEGIWWTLVMFVSISSNSMTLASLIHSSEQKVVFEEFLKSLFISNLLTSVVTLSLLTIDCYFMVQNGVLIFCYKILWSLSFAVNKFFILLLHLDRYLRIARSDLYTSFMTAAKGRCLRKVCWACAFICSVIGAFALKEVIIVLAFITVAASSALVLATFPRLRVSRHQREDTRHSESEQYNSAAPEIQSTCSVRILVYLSFSFFTEHALLLSPLVLMSLLLLFPSLSASPSLVNLNRTWARFSILSIAVDPALYIWICFKFQRGLAKKNVVHDHVFPKSADTAGVDVLTIVTANPKEMSENENDTSNSIRGILFVPDLQVVAEESCEFEVGQSGVDKLRFGKERCVTSPRTPEPSLQEIHSPLGSKIALREEWPEGVHIRSAHRPSICFVRALDMVKESGLEE